MTDSDETPAPSPHTRELLLQVRALLRHAVNAASAPRPAPVIVRFGPVEIDLGKRVVRRHHVIVALTPREFALLAALAERFGLAVHRDELLHAVWGTPQGPTAKYRTIDQHISRLRRKLEPLPSHPRYIQTVLGFGYRLGDREPPSPPTPPDDA